MTLGSHRGLAGGAQPRTWIDGMLTWSIVPFMVGCVCFTRLFTLSDDDDPLQHSHHREHL